MSLRFIVPQAIAPSGGHNYNSAIIRHWPGTPPELYVVRGSWPQGGDASRAALTKALEAPRVLVDGLVGAAQPDLIEQAVSRGSQVALLIHMPLPDEGGLDDEQRARFAELERRSILAATRVLATSHTAAADILSRYGRHAVPVPPGVETGPVSDPNDPPHLMAIGAIGERKNQLAFAAALRECRDLDWRATVVGPVVDADYAARLDAALPSRAIRRSAFEPSQISELLAGADLLVHPSTSETWGMVVTEALAHGVPALVSAGTGAVEALSSGTPEGADLPGAAVEPDQWGATLRAFLTDRELRSRWRDAALAARANARGWDQVATELAAALDEAVPGDERVLADWLSMRGQADRDARQRSVHLVEACARHLDGGGTAIDLGSGTGANHDYLAPRLPGTRWVLLDHDAELLEHSTADAHRVVGGLDRLPELVADAAPPVLVTCSALLDVLTASDLESVAQVLADTGAVGLFAMSVDGQVHFEPPLLDDELVTDAFNAHQRRRGRPGPDGARHLTEVARGLGLDVETVPTPWVLEPCDLTRRLLKERAEAASQQRPEHAGRIAAWLEQRLQRTERIVIGHVDLLIT